MCTNPYVKIVPTDYKLQEYTKQTDNPSHGSDNNSLRPFLRRGEPRVAAVGDGWKRESFGTEKRTKEYIDNTRHWSSNRAIKSAGWKGETAPHASPNNLPGNDDSPRCSFVLFVTQRCLRSLPIYMVVQTRSMAWFSSAPRIVGETRERAAHFFFHCRDFRPTMWGCDIRQCYFLTFSLLLQKACMCVCVYKRMPGLSRTGTLAIRPPRCHRRRGISNFFFLSQLWWA